VFQDGGILANRTLKECVAHFLGDRPMFLFSPLDIVQHYFKSGENVELTPRAAGSQGVPVGRHQVAGSPPSIGMADPVQQAQSGSFQHQQAGDGYVLVRRFCWEDGRSRGKELAADNLVPGRHAEPNHPRLLGQREALGCLPAHQVMSVSWFGPTVRIEGLMIDEQHIGAGDFDAVSDYPKAASRDDVVSVHEPDLLTARSLNTLVPRPTRPSFIYVDYDEPWLANGSFVQQLAGTVIRRAVNGNYLDIPETLHGDRVQALRQKALDIVNRDYDADQRL